MTHPYKCAECGAEVKVADTGHITRTCIHHGATVIAERTSILYGEGGAAGVSLIDRARAALRKLALAFS